MEAYIGAQWDYWINIDIALSYSWYLLLTYIEQKNCFVLVSSQEAKHSVFFSSTYETLKPHYQAPK